jgi:hypothetical protein
MLSVLLGKNPFIFYEGSTSANDAVPFTVRLDGQSYAVDLRNYARTSVATLRDAVVSTGQVDDSLFNTDGAWWRYRRNWHGGAGQSIMDLGDNRDARRFNTSIGIDVWTEGQLRLLPSTGTVNTTVNGSNIQIVTTESHIYIMDSAGVYRSSDMSTWTEITGLAGTPQALASDGIDVYIGTTTKLFTVDPSSAAASQLHNGEADGLWFVGNYLLKSRDNHLYSMSTSGTETLILEHFQTSFKWTTAFAVGSKIYAGGYAGIKSELYGFSISSAGALVVGAEAAPFGQNELLINAVSHVGVVLICTNKGIRLSNVGQDGSITYGPLIDDPGYVRGAFAEGRYIWFTWSNMATGKTGCGRVDISITPAELQPAYATDVYAEATGTVTAVARFNNRTVFGVATHGVYASSTTGYVTSGTLSSGKIYYGAVEQKSVTDALADFAQLAANQKITVSVTNDLGEEINTATASLLGQVNVDVQLDGEQGNYFVVDVMLEGPGTSTPTFHYWRLRAFPVVPPVEQFLVPLMLFSKTVVNDGQGQLMSMSTSEQLQNLVEVWQSKRPVTYVEGTESRRVRIEAYEYKPHDWADTHNGFEGILTVRLVTL